MDLNDKHESLLDMGVSEETIQVVSNINGYSHGTLNDILYVVSGLHDFDQTESN